MRRFCLPLALLLALSALLLSGCGGRAAEKRYEDFSAELAAAEGLSFRAELRCEYPDRQLSFTLAYRLQGEEETITVLAPEEIAGIAARRTDGGTALEYDGLILETGDLDPYGLSPMNALPLLTDRLARGHLDSWWTEGEETVLCLVRDDHLSARVSFDAQMRPLRAELMSDESMSIFCEIEDWRQQ